MNIAYKQVHVAYNAALDYFSNKDEDANWIIPVVVSISNDLRLIAGLVSTPCHALASPDVSEYSMQYKSFLNLIAPRLSSLRLTIVKVTSTTSFLESPWGA
jgi:hypothetical protein